MKIRYYILTLTALLFVNTAVAATGEKDKNKKGFFKINPDTGFPKYTFGIHTGLDIGAAVPFPPSNLNGISKLSAVPALTPALGISANMRIDPRWSLSVEVTYKQMGIDAKAWTNNQRFTDPDDPSLSLNFRGTVHMGMKFSMLEIPVYAGYSFNKNETRLIAGLYYSQIFSSTFWADPKKGILTSVSDPDEFPSIVSPENPIGRQNFDDSMSNFDVGFLLGYEWKVIERLHLGARFAMGFKDIFKKDEKFLDYNMLPMRGTVTISYKIIKIK